jgi:hypothetical protein
MSSLPPNVKVELILIPSAIVLRLTIGKFEIDEQMEKKVHITVKEKMNQEYKGKYSKLIYYCWIQKSKILLVTSRSRRTRP